MTERQRQLLAPMPMSADDVADLVHRTRIEMVRAKRDAVRASAEARTQARLGRGQQWGRWLSRKLRRREQQRWNRALHERKTLRKAGK